MTQDRARKSEVRALAAELGINYTEARRMLLGDQPTNTLHWDGISPEFGSSLSIIGQSGSGKSAALAELAHQLSEGDSRVFLAAPNTYGYFRDLDEVDQFAATTDGVLTLLRTALEEHDARYDARKVAPGTTYPPLYLLIDDCPTVEHGLSPEQREEARQAILHIAISGRSVNVHLVIASQEIPRGSEYRTMAKLALRPDTFAPSRLAEIRPNPTAEVPSETGSGLLVGLYGSELSVQSPAPKQNLAEIISLREEWPGNRWVTRFRLNEPISWFRREGKQTRIVGFSVTERDDELWGGILRVTDLLATGKFSKTEWSVHDEHLRDIGDDDLPELRAAINEAISRLSRTVA